MRRFIHALLFLLLLPAAGQTQEKGTFLHTIAKGESLYSIAAMYNVTTADIIRLNPGSEQVIKAGATLRIPQKEGGTSGKRFHTIQPGETLYRLTQVYGVAAQQICEANPGLTATNFRAGQVIVIPSSQAAAEPAAAPSAARPAETAQEQSGGSQIKYQDMHRVKRKETIYSLCKEYGITRQELLDANPELRTGPLKKGSYVRIPYPKKPGLSSFREETRPTQPPTDAELFREAAKKEHRTDKTVKVAVILPFLPESGSTANEQKRMVEYYEGFLMAVDSLQQSGCSFDIHAYDSGRSDASLRELLGRPEMKQMNLLIGPVHAAQIREAADFARENGIRMVVPFSSKDDAVFNNPYIYQINTPQSYLYSEVYDHFFRCFRGNYRLIFVDTRDGNGEKTEFIKGLKAELDNRRMAYQELTIVPGTTPDLREVADPAKENLFIPVSGSNIALTRLMPCLKQLSLEAPEYSVHLFGYPEWQTYTTDYIADFYAFDTYFYGSFYANNLSVAVSDFQRSYRRWYGKTLLNTYPKYAILGFDTGYFFLRGLSQYGDLMEENLGKIHFSPIQTSFRFERVNNWGGFLNKKVFFVHFTRENELIKMDFDQ